MAQLIADYSNNTPMRVALADERGETNWSQFNQRVNQLIHALRATGLSAGETFAIYSGNRREYFEAITAAAHGGWLFVPINWHLVEQEVSYILDNSDAKVLFTEARFLDTAQAVLGQNSGLVACISFDQAVAEFSDYEGFIADQPSTEPEQQSMGGPMFYTSGTTGQPKGVRSGSFGGDASLDILKMMGHGMSGMLSMPGQGRTLLEGPIYHSAQWAFSFLPLVAGNAVYMRHRFVAEETLALIDEYQITNVHLVPTQFVRLLRADEQAKQDFKGDSLAIVWHGAAPCSLQTKRQMIDWWGPKIHEYYGSTEGSIISTCSSQEWLQRPGTLGKIVPIIEPHIINESGQPAATGESGQLYFKNLMGNEFHYHKDPKKTAEAFLEPGVFTFGDMGYMDADGYLFMSDRKIDMIISGGVNVYPAEIEGVLIQHPAVADAAVFGIPNEEWGEEVKAAIELNDAHASQPIESLKAEILAFCADSLAKFKVPRSIDIEQKLPRAETGKLYKRILRDKYWPQSGNQI